MGDRELGQFGMATSRGEPQAGQRCRLRRDGAEGAAIAAQNARSRRAPPAATARPRRARRWNRRAAAAASRVATVSEKTWRPHQPRHLVVEAAIVGQPAAEHDRVRVEHVDDTGQAARQPVGVAVERRPALPDRRRRRRRRSPARLSLLPGMAAVVGGQPRPRQKGLDAAAPAAIAGRPGQLLRRAATAAGCGPTRRRSRWRRPASGRRSTMPPPTPVPRMTPNTVPQPGARAVGRLRQREAIGVVGEAHRAAERRLEIARRAAGRSARSSWRS